MATASRSRGPWNSAWASRGVRARSALPCLYRSCAALQSCSHGENPGKRSASGASSRVEPARRQTRLSPSKIELRSRNRQPLRRASRRGSDVDRGRPKPFTGAEVEVGRLPRSIALKPISRTTSPQARPSSPITAQCPIGHARGRMAGSSQAPVLILTAPDALAPSIAVAVRAAAAQRERGTNRRR